MLYLKNMLHHHNSWLSIITDHEAEKDFPYLVHEVKNANETGSSKKKTLKQKLARFCRPRGCFLTRHDYALYIFSPQNPIRRFCKQLSSKKWFDYLILILIGLNCISLAVERPSIPPYSLVSKLINCQCLLYKTNSVLFCCIFVILLHSYTSEILRALIYKSLISGEENFDCIQLCLHISVPHWNDDKGM